MQIPIISTLPPTLGVAILTAMNEADKSMLRRELRRRRQALSPHERSRAVHAVLRHIKHANFWRRGRRWAFYLPFGSEFDCMPLMVAAQRWRREIYLPVVGKANDGKLVFVHVDHAERWSRSRMGMLEPVSRRFVSARRLDVICMPLLGFDAAGGRLGQGGGYYDRTLAFRRLGLRRPLLVGLAFECQRVDAIPMEAWDVRLDWVATEAGIHRLLENI